MKNVIIVFGGAVNPVANHHLALAEQVYEEYKEVVDHILWMPVSDLYPKKGLIPAEHRVAMLKTVCATNPHFKTSTVEVDSPILLHTLDMLDQVQAQYPYHEIWCALGTDNLKQLDTWYQYETMLTKYKIVVMQRDKDNAADIIQTNPHFDNYVDSFKIATETIRGDGNSSAIRYKLAHGQSIRYLVPDIVYDYILSNDLYVK